jgi:hypothetical protein
MSTKTKMILLCEKFSPSAPKVEVEGAGDE